MANEVKFPQIYLRFHFLLDTHNMTAQELADKTNIGKSSISHYYNGVHAPSAKAAEKIAAVFGVDPLWIRGFDVPMMANPETETDEQVLQKFRLLTYENKLRMLERIDMLLEQQEEDR